MKCRLIIAICLTIAAGHLSVAARVDASPMPAPSATDSPNVDPKIMAKAKEWFRRFQAGSIDRTQLNQAVNHQLTRDMIVRERDTLRKYGAPLGFRFISSNLVGGLVGYNFLLTFKDARIVEAIAFDSDGKIGGIDFEEFVLDSN